MNKQGNQNNRQPDSKNNKNQPKVLLQTNARRGEVQAASRRNSELVNKKASQHIIDIPVNKSPFNGLEGRQFSASDQKRVITLPIKREKTLRIIPMGGLGEMGIGKNMTAIQYEDEIIVIDMGMLFPGSDYPGINYIIPDTKWLEERKSQVKALLFTHGHLDHIGAFKHIVQKLNAPVYSTKFTNNMMERQLKEIEGSVKPFFNNVNPDTHEKIRVGKHFSIEFVRVNHSIPDSTAIIIRTPIGNVLHSGDWRFERDPIDEKQFDKTRLSEVAAKEGFLVMLNESTNCEVEGRNDHSEKEIGESFDQLMKREGRIIISSFSSQLHRIQSILEAAKKNGRKVAFSGHSMIQNLEVALRSNVIRVPSDVIMKMEDIIKLPDRQVTVVCTGSQGEFDAVLARMITGNHKHIKVKNTDTIVLSSNPIPGNEQFVVRTVDGLMREGSDVVQNRTRHLDDCGLLHMSGHGSYDDHVELIEIVNPKYYVPIHGEFHMLNHNAELAVNSARIAKNHVFVLDNGDILELTKNDAARTGRIPVGGVMYDRAGSEVSEVVLKDRIHMSHEGMFIVVLTVSKKTGRLLTSPDIISRGFIYLRDSEEIINTIRTYLRQKITQEYAAKPKVDIDDLKKSVREDVAHILFDKTSRTPIVIPVINEIETSLQSKPAS